MAKHQIIYTSCMRGIEGVNDGQQVFSCDESFTDRSSDEVKALFAYHVPTLPSGVLMSEEIAKTMPQEFMYKALSNGTVALTLNTYLGRDYMGSAGRFGNHLSHSIVCDSDDMDFYPCEMYASTSLRSSMNFEEVNNPEPPAYLPEPELVKGYVIDPDAVIEFLSIGENIGYYTKMVMALLQFSETKRRVIICDDPENVIKWIAALQYTLPLEIAKQVNFSTYVYNPELSYTQICGVIPEGSRYSVDAYLSSGDYFVFDFKAQRFSEVEFTGQLSDFLETAFSFSYESLLDFHNFIISKTTYRECGKGLLVAYDLYSLLSDSISEIPMDQFDKVVEFVSEYSTPEIKEELIGKLIEDNDQIDQLDNTYALNVLCYILSSYSSLEEEKKTAIKQMIIDRLIVSFSSEGITEESFMPVFDKIDNMARQVGLSIPADLMVDHNREKLFRVLENRTELWKASFIIRIVSEYAKDMRISEKEYAPDESLGKIYCGIYRLMFDNDSAQAIEIVKQTLSYYEKDIGFISAMALNIESYLDHVGRSDKDVRAFWGYFYKVACAKDAYGFERIVTDLIDFTRYFEAYALYRIQMSLTNSLSNARSCFSRWWNMWFSKEPGFGREYAKSSIGECVARFDQVMHTADEKETYETGKSMLYLVMGMHINEPYVDKLYDMICKSIPLEKPDPEKRNLINEMYSYQLETLKRPAEGHLLLIVIAMNLTQITTSYNLVDAIKGIKVDETIFRPANLSGIAEDKLKDYFEWAFSTLKNLRFKDEEFALVYSLFAFDRMSQLLFMDYWCRISYKKSKGDKDYEDFSEFIAFMFSVGGPEEKEMVGKFLCKLNKQKLMDLDLQMRFCFRRKDSALEKKWSEIVDVAASTNPLLNNLSGLFKKKKNE